MVERFGFLAFTYLLGYAVLWFGWACCREQLTVHQIARRIVLFGVGTFVALLAAEIVACLTVYASIYPCYGGCASSCPTPPDTAFSSFGVFR